VEKTFGQPVSYTVCHETKDKTHKCKKQQTYKYSVNAL